MTPARWGRIQTLLHETLDRPADARAAFLADACPAGETTVRREVESLAVQTTGPLERCAAGVAADRADEERDPNVGRRVGAWTLGERLGSGGMGTVYLARRADGAFEQSAALKLLKRGTDTEEVLRRFRAERQILARLDHPHIARLLDGGETDDGLPFLVMEHVAGLPLGEFMRAAELGLPRRLEMFLKVCAAVTYAHQNLVIHRDIKPANVRVTRGGEPKLLDFGIAKLLAEEIDAERTVAGHHRLTPAYAAPEQVRGEAVTTASDVYGLGALLYELLTGRPPHQFSSPRPGPAEVARVVGEDAIVRPSQVVGRPTATARTAKDSREPAKVSRRAAKDAREPAKENGDSSKDAGGFAKVRGERPKDGGERPKDDGDSSKDGRRPALPPPGALRGDLDNIVLKALEKDPARRYPTVNALAEDVRRHLDGRPVRARPPTAGYLFGRFIRRNRLAVAAGTLVALALVGGAAGTLWQAHRAQERFDDVRSLAHSVLFEFHDAIRDLPGATPVRRLLVTRALEYLDRLRPQAGNDPGLRRELAAAYVQVGHVQGRPNHPNLGDTTGAIVSYRQAVAVLEGLRDEEDAEVAAVRADAWDALGTVFANNGKPDEAKVLQRRALVLRERLLRQSPADAQRQRDVAASLVSLADTVLAGAIAVWNQPTIYPEALQLYLRALPLRERLHADHPDDADLARELAAVHYQLGNLYYISGAGAAHDRALCQKGLEHHQISVALREETLAAHPASASARRNLADALAMKSEVQTVLGDPTGALADCRRAVGLFEALVAADPGNFWARQDLAFTHYCAAVPQRALGDLSGALASLDQATALYEGLLATDPTSLTPVSHLNHILRLRSEICAEQGDEAGRRESARRWAGFAGRLSAASPADQSLREEFTRATEAAGAGSSQTARP